MGGRAGQERPKLQRPSRRSLGPQKRMEETEHACRDLTLGNQPHGRPPARRHTWPLPTAPPPATALEGACQPQHGHRTSSWDGKAKCMGAAAGPPRLASTLLAAAAALPAWSARGSAGWGCGWEGLCPAPRPGSSRSPKMPPSSSSWPSLVWNMWPSSSSATSPSPSPSNCLRHGMVVGGGVGSVCGPRGTGPGPGDARCPAHLDGRAQPACVMPWSWEACVACSPRHKPGESTTRRRAQEAGEVVAGEVDLFQRSPEPSPGARRL